MLIEIARRECSPVPPAPAPAPAPWTAGAGESCTIEPGAPAGSDCGFVPGDADSCGPGCTYEWAAPGGPAGFEAPAAATRAAQEEAQRSAAAPGLL